LHKHGELSLFSLQFANADSTKSHVANEKFQYLIFFDRTLLHGANLPRKSPCTLLLTTMNSISKNLSLLLGPLSFASIWWWQPAGLDVAQAKVLGVVAWMLVWWIAESVPMGVTSLLPIILFPILGVLSLEKTCLAYSNRYVFLFLGGFLIALAMEKWNCTEGLH